MKQKSVDPSLPILQDLTLDYILTLVVALLMTVLSVLGLFFPTTVYPSQDLQESFMINDLLNLILGLPILLGSIWLARRRKLMGLLFWPGALLYVLYNYIANSSGTPLSLFTMGYLAIILISAYIVFDLLRKIDRELVSEQLAGAVSEKIAGWVLMLFGVAFLFRAIGMIAGTGTNPSQLSAGEIGTLVADLVLSTLWIVGGFNLLQRKPLGYVGGLGLLFAVSMLFIGLILFLVINPFFTDAAFLLSDVIVVFIMGMIGFIPFGLYLRGVFSVGE
jgi:hypothetical protein